MAREKNPLTFFNLRGDELLLAALAVHEVNFTDAQEKQKLLRRRLRKAVKDRFPEAYEKHLAANEAEDQAEEFEARAEEVRKAAYGGR